MRFAEIFKTELFSKYGQKAGCYINEIYDYLIGMDSMNIRNIMRIIGKDTQKKVYRLLDFSDSPRDIADPWYTGNFDRTYEDSVEGCRALLEKIKQEYDL